MNITEKHKLVIRRSEIYLEFISYLTHTIVRLYPGSDVIIDNESMMNFYNYCFDRTCDEFKKQNINFENNIELRNRFVSYFENEFFSGRFKTYSETIELWKNIFDSNTYITNGEILKVFSKTYNIFNQSINPKSLNKVFFDSKIKNKEKI